MIRTTTGFKVVLGSSIGEAASEINSSINFVEAVHKDGIWYALTGKHIGEWLAEVGHNLLNWIVTNSDLLLVPGMFLVLFAMAGSKKSSKWLYWVIISYIVLKALGGYML